MPERSHQAGFRRKISPPYYPLFVTSYPFLHFWAVNVSAPESLAGLVPYYLYALACMAVLWVFLGIILKSFYKGAFFASAGILFFFSYGHVSNLLKTVMEVRSWWLLSGFSLILFGVVLFYLKKNKEFFLKAAFFLNVSMGIAVISLLSAIAPYSLFPPPLDLSFMQRRIKISAKPSLHPDIYYIILDEYARNDMLEKYYGYSNEDFTSELKKLGFYVAEKSNSNYAYTTVSLTSSLNLNYVHELSKDSARRELLFEELNKKNRIARFLKRLGYRYILFDSGIFDFTSRSSLANEIIPYEGGGQLETVFLNTTVLGLLARNHFSESWRAAHIYNFNKLGKIASEPGPKFIFVHFLLPHPPFVFDANGGRVNERKISINMGRPELYARDYLGQLIYTNKLALKALKQILENSAREPVIVLQSDHGAEWIPRPAEWWNTQDAMQERYANLTAVYLPKGIPNSFYPDITPVNIFRLLFRDLFNAKLEPLPNRIYLDCESTWINIEACKTDGGRGFRDITSQIRPA